MNIGSRSLLGKLLLIAAAYLVAGKLGLLLAIPPGYATAIWPPSGLALGALILWGRRCWPGVWLGSVLTNILVISQSGISAQALLAPAIIGAGAALQAVLGSLLIERVIATPRLLARERDILGFFVLGGPIASLVNASVGVITLRLMGQIPADTIAYSWWTWWSGDTIGAMIFGPLMLMWFGGREWDGRRLAVTIPLVAMFAAAVLVFVYASRLEWQGIERRFHEDAQDITAAIERRLDLNIELLHSVGGLFAASQNVEREEFANFASVMLSQHPDLQAVEWAQRIPEMQRPDFEKFIRDWQSDRLGIFERGIDGRRPADSRDVYYAVKFAEPQADNLAALGFDMGSEHTRRRVLEQARDTSKVTATSPVELVQTSGAHDGVLIFLPVYATGGKAPAGLAQRRETLMGFAIAAIRTHELVGLAIQERPATQRVRLRMTDADATADTLLYGAKDEGARRSVPSTPQDARHTLSYRMTLEVAGRAWTLDFTPKTASVSRSGSFVAWMVLAAGLIFSALVSAGALVVTGRTAAVEAVVKERTLELARTNEQLAKANRLKGEFVSTISHELRTPLTSIRGSLGLINGGAVGELPEAARKLVDIAYRNTDRLAILINDILDIEKIDSGEMSVELALHPLPALVEQTVEANNGYAQSCDVRFLLHKPLPDVAVLADAHRLSQVMANLLSNAAKFSPPRSTIDIFASAVKGKVRVCVQDRGPGIPLEFQSRIFKRFSQADGSDSRAKGGTGLGLAISKALIEQMNGSIGYQTEAGKGTTFFFELPIINK